MRLLLLLLLGVFVVDGYNILVLVPHPGASHFYAFAPLFKELSRRNHNVTVVSYLPLKKPLPNYRDVDLTEHMTEMKHVIDMNVENSLWMGPMSLAEFAETFCTAAFETKKFQNFLKEDHKFDLILMEYFNTNCYNGLLQKYKAPVIALSSCTIMPWTNPYFGNPDNPSYIPNVFLDHSDQMTFMERVENSLMYIVSQAVFDFVIKPKGRELSKKYLGIDIDESEEPVYKTSLMLANIHNTLNLPRPITPNIIEVGGLFVPEKTKPLPENIEKWINESSEGVIYFSLGSMIKGHTFPQDKRRAFLKAFARLPQRVLWKWENETMDGKPDNVMIQKWMPQFDILCHPNVRAFISHGGLLGTTEAVHCGVPIIVMPQFGDQFTNAKAIEANGGGVILHLKEATEEKVYKALETVLSPKFRAQTKELSARFRDRPLPPLETAIYWVEYVARHKGAPHMRTAAVNMPFYQYYLLDVIAFLFTVFLLATFVVFYTVRGCLRVIFQSNKKVKTN